MEGVSTWVQRRPSLVEYLLSVKDDCVDPVELLEEHESHRDQEGPPVDRACEQIPEADVVEGPSTL